MHYKNAINIESKIDNEIVTQTICLEIIQTIIEFLAFYRNQIPLSYDTFKYLINDNKLKNVTISSSETEEYNVGSNYLMVQQQTMAEKTLNSFIEIFQHLTSDFKNHEIEKVAILYGATPFSPKEAYIINLPEISRHHSPSNYNKSNRSVCKKVILSLMKSQTFFDMGMMNIKPTNGFVLIKLKQHEIENTLVESNNSTNDNMLSIENCQSSSQIEKNQSTFYSDFFQPTSSEIHLSKSCKTTVINIVANNTIQMGGGGDTKDILIFNDDSSNNNNNSNNLKNDCNKSIQYDHNLWYESKICIKGFKDTLVNGKSIWTN